MRNDLKGKPEDDGVRAMKPVNTCDPAPMTPEHETRLWRERAFSTDRHKNALEGLVIQHHDRIEEQVAEIEYLRATLRQSQQVENVVREELSEAGYREEAHTIAPEFAARCLGRIIEKFDEDRRHITTLLVELAKPENWSGSIFTGNSIPGLWAQELLMKMAERPQVLASFKTQ